MSNAGTFIAALKGELRQGNLSVASEQHLRNEFRRIGWDGRDDQLAAAVDEEIGRLEREIATLHRLRASYFGVA
jgi:hypothetical protein